MPLKVEEKEAYREIDRWERGVGWIAHPEEAMQRAGHALVGDDGDVWVVDPVDARGLDDLLAEFGSVAGVAVCLDRHKRDAATIANRLGVPVYVPRWMTGVVEELDAPVERFDRELGSSGFEAFRTLDSDLLPWQEAGLYHREDGTLLIPEAVGTAEFFRAPGERLGVHPMLRPFPPRRALRGFAPERILVGHGAGVTADATGALANALDGARRNLPAAYARAIRNVLS